MICRSMCAADTVSGNYPNRRLTKAVASMSSPKQHEPPLSLCSMPQIQDCKRHPIRCHEVFHDYTWTPDWWTDRNSTAVNATRKCEVSRQPLLSTLDLRNDCNFVQLILLLHVLVSSFMAPTKTVCTPDFWRARDYRRVRGGRDGCLNK